MLFCLSFTRQQTSSSVNSPYTLSTWNSVNHSLLTPNSIHISPPARHLSYAVGDSVSLFFLQLHYTALLNAIHAYLSLLFPFSTARDAYFLASRRVVRRTRLCGSILYSFWVPVTLSAWNWVNHTTSSLNTIHQTFSVLLFLATSDAHLFFAVSHARPFLSLRSWIRPACTSVSHDIPSPIASRIPFFALNCSILRDSRHIFRSTYFASFLWSAFL